MAIFVSPDKFLAVLKTLGMPQLRIKVKNIALKTGIPYTIVHLILTESLALQKIGSTWVPKAAYGRKLISIFSLVRDLRPQISVRKSAHPCKAYEMKTLVTQSHICDHLFHRMVLRGACLTCKKVENPIKSA